MARQRGGAEPAFTPGLIESARRASLPLSPGSGLSPLLRRVGDARCVLLGGASHGTREYHTWRTEITKRLIGEWGFTFVAVEGDWPACYRVNRFVKGYVDGPACEALAACERWPAWVWANEEVAELAGWLRRHNDGRPEDAKAGFYGLDVYSLWESLHQAAAYLKKYGGGAGAAERALRCFDPYGGDPREHALATRWIPERCEGEVAELLREIRARAPSFPEDGEEDRFAAEQNARAVRDAEAYYRAMGRGGSLSWDARERHMDETLGRLLAFHGPGAKGVVWAHNTHSGDARHTDMATEGMVNLGQLARTRFGEASVSLVGFGCHRGWVFAAQRWDAGMECMPVPPARDGSWEDILHRSGAGDSLLLLGRGMAAAWEEPRGHRAIGVVYRPQYEGFGNYVPTVLPRRYDAFIYLEQTRALRPLGAGVPSEGVLETCLSRV